MQWKWIERSGNDSLILFFNGWGMDERPFDFLDRSGFDILMCYNYRDLNLTLPDLSAYPEKFLVAWSSGVRAADVALRYSSLSFCHGIALNGTAYTVDSELGIAPELFKATIDAFSKKNRDRFFRRMMTGIDAYKRFISSSPHRDLEEQKAELQAILKNSMVAANVDNLFDRVFIATKDRIVPTENQECYWKQQKSVTLKRVEGGHFSFYRWKSWKEIIDDSLAE